MDERYWIEMPDGQRYGPADLATLRAWRAEGRVVPESVLVSETTGAHLRADSRSDLFPSESNDVAAPPIATLVPPVPPTFAATVAPRKSSSSWIVLAVVFGAMGLCGVSILAAILFPVFAQAKRAAYRTSGLSSLKLLGTGILLYQGDADDHFPPAMASARDFEPAMIPYVKQSEIFRSANPAGGEILGDARLSGRTGTYLTNQSQTVMLHDSLPWSGGRGLIGRADGSAKNVAFPTIAALMAPDPYAGLTREQERRKEKAASR